MLINVYDRKTETETGGERRREEERKRKGKGGEGRAENMEERIECENLPSWLVKYTEKAK